MLLGMLVTGSRGGLGLHPPRVRPRGGGAARRDRALREEGLLGDDALGSGRRLQLEIFTSPGGYILGEESALLECMEGHRGEPRNKPPFPGLYGLWGKPTLMNSVETFADVPIILERGADWWKEQGVNGGEGLKFFAVSGHVERPDVYCVPAGSTTRDLIELAGGVTEGREVGAIQPGGASSNFLGPEHLDVPLDWKPLQEAGSMLGSGAVIVMAEGTNLLAAATNVLRFFRNESCGKCVPCRVGSHKAHAILSDLVEQGRAPTTSHDEITQLEETLRLTSICGLGQVALGPGDVACGAAAREQPKDRADTEMFLTVMTTPRRSTRSTGRRRPAAAIAVGPAGRSGVVPGRADVRAARALPGCARSTVDGYAVRAADTYAAPRCCPRSSRSPARWRWGVRRRARSRRAAAMAIPTGGLLPHGADAVVMVEHTQGADARARRVMRRRRTGRRRAAARRGGAGRATCSCRPAGRCARRTSGCWPRPA